MKALSVLLAVACIAAAQVYLEDDFSDGDYDGWIVHSNGTVYEVTAGEWFRMSHTGPEDIYGLAYTGDVCDTMSVSDYCIQVETIAQNPTGKVGISLRYCEEQGTSYSLYLNYSTNRYYILRYDAFTSWTVISDTRIYDGGFVYGTKYNIRFECSGDQMRVKIWETEEPQQWMLEAQDGVYSNCGSVTLEVVEGPTLTAFDAEFDNVVVACPLALEPLTWAGIKSSFN